jgi:hypothetical protein
MTQHEQQIREALDGKPLMGPWQVRMCHNNWGETGFRVLTHCRPSICVAAEDYYAPGCFPETDEDGYYQPDKRIDCLPHNVANVRYIAATNPEAMQAILDELDRVRDHAARWEQRARSLGWTDEPNG